MTENTNRPRELTPKELDEIQWERKKREQRAAWEEERQQRREQKAREEKQARLEAYLKRRGQEWMDTTGSPPPQHVLEGWQQDYADLQEAEYQRKRQAKLAEAESQYPY
jgi:hypothetical protein